MNTTEAMTYGPAVALARANENKRLSSPVHLEDFPDGLESASEEVKSGRASLRLSVFPWGVEFDIVRRETAQAAQLVGGVPNR